MKSFGNTDNFKNVWNVIEDSARYAFILLMLIQWGVTQLNRQWFKAHYTKTFYE